MSALPDAEAPPAADHGRAKPGMTTTTGRAHLAEYGATLAANFTITQQENEFEYPLTVHTLDATVLFQIFYTIIFEICTTINRELGVQDFTVLAQLVILRNIAKSVAFDAMEAAYAVLYNKARRYDPNVIRGNQMPAITFTSFPIFVATLINALGPVQRADLPSRRTHVPFMQYSSLQNTRPIGYAAYLSARFQEKFAKTKYLSAHVEYQGVASNAWWTFWPEKLSSSSIESLMHDNDPLSSFRIFSPIKYDEIEPYFKLATIYGRRPLVCPGICFFTTTPWYEESIFPRFTGMPPPNTFPAETRAYPFFVSTCSAYMATVDRRSVRLAPPEAQPTAATSTTTSAVRNTRRLVPPSDRVLRSRSPTSSNVANASQHGTKRVALTQQPESGYEPQSPDLDQPDDLLTQYRIKYFYFDHIAIAEAKPHEYQSWAIELNKQ